MAAFVALLATVADADPSPESAPSNGAAQPGDGTNAAVSVQAAGGTDAAATNSLSESAPATNRAAETSAAPSNSATSEVAGGSAAGDGVTYIVTGIKPPFTAMTAGKVALAGAFGAVGGVAEAVWSMSAGDKIIRENGVDDPAKEIAKTVATKFAAIRGGHLTAAPVDGDHVKAADLPTHSGGARYVVFVRTGFWGFSYYSLDWTHYHVTYGAALRVFDTQSNNAVILKGICTHKYVAEHEKFTYSELTDNGAATLKAQLEAAGDECVARFEADLEKVKPAQ